MLDSAFKTRLLNLNEEEAVQAMEVLEKVIVERVLKKTEYPIHTPLVMRGGASQLRELLEEHETA